MNEYEINRKWSDTYGLQMKSILKRFRGLICDRLTPESIDDSSFFKDTQHCVDAVMVMPDIEASFRVRNAERYTGGQVAKYSREFTLRTHNNGHKTELDKYMALSEKDKASVYIYAFADGPEIITASVFDMRVFCRECVLNDELKNLINPQNWTNNRDRFGKHDGTAFVAIPVWIMSDDFVIGKVSWLGAQEKQQPQQISMFGG
jgi:hypothetical protein